MRNVFQGSLHYFYFFLGRILYFLWPAMDGVVGQWSQILSGSLNNNKNNNQKIVKAKTNQQINKVSRHECRVAPCAARLALVLCVWLGSLATIKPRKKFGVYLLVWCTLGNVGWAGHSVPNRTGFKIIVRLPLCSCVMLNNLGNLGWQHTTWGNLGNPGWHHTSKCSTNIHKHKSDPLHLPSLLPY